MVHHMTGDDWDDLDDSTANHWDITNDYGNPAYNQDGILGKCVDFDGSGDFLKTSHFRLTTDIIC